MLHLRARRAGLGGRFCVMDHETCIAIALLAVAAVLIVASFLPRDP